MSWQIYLPPYGQISPEHSVYYETEEKALARARMLTGTATWTLYKAIMYGQ